MKKALVPLFVIVAALAGCAPHIHLDFLGQEKLAEIVLLPGPEAKKILMIDIEGVISTPG